MLHHCLAVLLLCVATLALHAGEATKGTNDATKKEALKKAIEAARIAAEDASKPSAAPAEAPKDGVPSLETKVVLYDGLRPAVEDPLTDAEYESRLKKALADHDKAGFDRDGPSYKLRVIEVSPNMPAQKAGLRVGDVIVRMNGQPIRDPHAMDFEKRPPDAKLGVIGTDGKERDIIMPGQRAGFGTASAHDAYVTYCEKGSRSPKWDDAVFAACRTWKTDPELALSALLRAEKVGFKNYDLTDAVRALALLWLNRVPEAAAQVQSAVTPARLPKSPRYLLSTFTFTNDAVAFMVQQRAGAASQTGASSPIEKAKGMLRDSLLLRATQTPPVESPSRRRAMEQNTGYLAATGGLNYALKPDMYHVMVFGPAVKNVELVARISFDAPANRDGRATDFPSLFALGFSDDLFSRWNEYSWHGSHEETLSFAKRRIVTVEPGWTANWPDVSIVPSDPALFKTLGKGTHLLHMTVLDGIGEVRLNGKRVFLGPVKTDSGLIMPVIRARDIVYRLENVQINELVDPANTKHAFFTEPNKPLFMGLSRIHWAAERQSPAQVRALIASGAKLDQKSPHGEWPIHAALRNGRRENAKILKEAGSPSDLTVLACLGTGEEIAAAAKAAPAEMKGTLPWAPLHGAAKWGNAAAVKALLDAGADVNQKSDKRLREFSPLMMAAENGQLVVVKLLLARGANPAQTDQGNLTAYNYALLSENKEVIELLKAHKGGSPAVRPPAPPSDEF